MDHFWLNGERISLMALSAWPGAIRITAWRNRFSWIEHDHDDLKNLNCVFTRVHWATGQARFSTIATAWHLIQTEVPTWGPDTFKDMKTSLIPKLCRTDLSSCGK